MTILNILTHIFAFTVLSQGVVAKDTTSKGNVAIFAGGCFWCMQPAFDALPGVSKTIVGYTGGHLQNPNYKTVTAGNSGHYEAIAVYYDEAKISYKKLLDVFWRNIDPTNATGQFCDQGPSYLAAIFYRNTQQQKLARASKDHLIKSKRFATIVTQILKATQFYPAEEYHQDYYKKNPVRYKYYRYRCGRDSRLNDLWGNNP